MRKLACTALMILGVVLGGEVALSAQIAAGIRIGPPPPPRVVHVVRPPAPGPAFFWVDGYWYPVGNHYTWRPGYWVQPPYPAAVWVAPRYTNGHYYAGYWK